VDGDYAVEGVPSGEHVIDVRHPSYLRSRRAFAVSAGETLALPDVTLLGGDVNQDDVIDYLDADVVFYAWNSAPADPHWNGAADVTDDGAVNVLDMVAVQYNWGEVAPSTWPEVLSTLDGGWRARRQFPVYLPTLLRSELGSPGSTDPRIGPSGVVATHTPRSQACNTLDREARKR